MKRDCENCKYFYECDNMGTYEECLPDMKFYEDIPISITFTRDVTFNELLEVRQLAEYQQTTDRYRDTTMHIDGNYASIDVEIDQFGDITVL